MGWIFFLTSQIGYPLNLIVTVKPCLKRPLNKRQKIVCFFKTDYRIIQVKSIAECSQGAFCNTFYLHLAPICLNDLCCVYLSVIHLQFRAYGSWDSLFPISMSPHCKLMSPKHYFWWQVCHTIASRDSLGLAEIKTYAQKIQDAQVTKSLIFEWPFWQV